MQYEVVIGVEVHAQLLTESKMFCGCGTRFGGKPNTQTCPVCLGLPGTLPVINKKAVDMAIKTSLAVNCMISAYNRFARKNYFYPDLPKGYQVSQYELPLGENGFLDIDTDGIKKRIRIRRVHMEEDAGKNLHEDIANASHVDLNRAGVPLLEIVSEPDIRSPEETVSYLKSLRDILIYLEVCDGNMDEGSFRCEPNISLRPAGSLELGTKTELKNINSFKFVQKALEYEIKRQEKTLREGGRVIQETRLWDPDREVTEAMRSKEEAHDYRYFPEPDLAPLMISREWTEEIRQDLPELPNAKRIRLVSQYGIPEYDATLLTSSKGLADYFERCVSLYNQPKTISNWIMVDLLRLLKEDNMAIEKCPLRPEQLAGMLKLIDEGTISGKIAKTVFEEMYRTGKESATIVKEGGLTQIVDESEIERVIEGVINSNPDKVEAYRKGKDKLFGFFVGEVMKASGGKANPAKVNDLLKKRLNR